MRDFCYCTDGVRGHLAVTVNGIPGDVYCYGQGRNILIGEWAACWTPMSARGRSLVAPSAGDHAAAFPSRRERRHGARRWVTRSRTGKPVGALGSVGRTALCARSLM